MNIRVLLLFWGALLQISDVCRSSLVIPGILCEGASLGEFQNAALTTSTKII